MSQPGVEPDETAVAAAASAPAEGETSTHGDDRADAHEDDHSEGHLHAEALGPVDLAAWGAGAVGFVVAGVTAMAFAISTGYL